MSEIVELNERVAELLIENARIKKTSSQRFNQVKELKSKSKQLDIVNSRFNSIRGFLVDNELPIICEGGMERIDFSAMNALRGLLKINKPSDTVSAEGTYIVKVDGKYKQARIKHYICWQILFVDDCNPEYNGLHHECVTEFILIELGLQDRS